ncbi:winged helix-turn-helix transcriptional regulator [Leucobacter sp. cx-328]|uniref:MarR family winged helix-turn-helix transcriptional regulator n=1 Tax=unclassified Leucobacter TaxID=2621730 RepID=UPI00165D62FB|nr:winged helix-turn-helix transcriptional regulator [Leucobacter sp. cx-328]
MNPTLLDRLLAISTLFKRNEHRSLKGTSLTAARIQAMQTLFHAGPSSQQALARAMGITPRSISSLIDGLVESGYAIRAADPHDRRAVLVTLTPMAHQEMRVRQLAHAEVSRELVRAIAPEDRAAFDRGLNAVFRKYDEIVRRG